MQVHFSFAAAVMTLLLIMPGTIGCRSNGGPWYKPDTYAFVNPFDKEAMNRGGTAPPFGADVAANLKPSLDAQPNISPPLGGYTAEGNPLAALSMGGSTQPPEAWGAQNLMSHQGAVPHQGPPGGYSVPEPSHYSPSDIYVTHGSAPHQGAPYQDSPQSGSWQYHEPVHQASNTLSQTSHQPTALQQPAHVPMGGVPMGGAPNAWEVPGQQSPHQSPFGGVMSSPPSPSPQDAFGGSAVPSGFPSGGSVYDQQPVPHQSPPPVQQSFGGGWGY